MSACGHVTNIPAGKRKRGRPPGLKNKPKQDAAALQTHVVLQTPAGGDVAETVASFASGCPTFGVCVLSASGPVAAAVLWEASPSPSTLTFQGRFDLLSMTATFLPGGSIRSLAVTLAGPQGQVVGGVVAGPVVAAGTVIVIAATFASPEFYPSDGTKNAFGMIGGEQGWGESLPAETNYSVAEEQLVELWTAAEGVVGVESGEEEVDEKRLKEIIREYEQCITLLGPAAGGSPSSTCVVADESDNGNMSQQYSDDSTIIDSAFGAFAAFHPLY